jgi:23S rRNA (cytidine2498-2'-O)-methyltransferase
VVIEWEKYHAQPHRSSHYPTLGEPGSQGGRLRADGFQWSPNKPLDWMVCDMVESPKRVAARMAQWFREGWCRHAIFNLKLPMKKRWDETRDCLAAFEAQAGRPLVVRARQLYHDREEVTVFATDPAARERQL